MRRQARSRGARSPALRRKIVQTQRGAARYQRAPIPTDATPVANLALFVSTVFIWGSTWIAIAMQIGPVPPLVSGF